MGDISYAPLIDDMVWSYSRIKSFEDCHYRWYLKYIKGVAGKEMFFASYGSFIHKILELYYKGELDKRQMEAMYLLGFQDNVFGVAPSQKVYENYFLGGLRYIRAFRAFPFSTIGVEIKVEFGIQNLPFVGYIDYLGKQNNDIYLIDNKSRTLSQRSTRSKPTKKDEELDSYLRQLYLYSIPVKEMYGIFPKKLCFNCFRNDSFIEEPFQEEAYEEAKQWAVDKIAEIRETSDFKPNIDYFRCRYLCEAADECDYFRLSKG